MSLINSEIIEAVQHKTHKRARFKYTFSNGDIIEIGPVRLADNETPEQRLSAMQPHAIQQAKNNSMRSLSDIIDSGEATKADVARYFLQRAMQSDTVEAYQLLNKFNSYRQAQGWTPAQVKAALNLTDEQWQAIVTRWQYLNSNAATIESFAALNDPRGEF